MALPTLRSYYKVHRPHSVAEGRIVSRRVLEEDVRQRWAENSKYFNSSNVRASKQEAWTSSKSFQGSMDAYHKRGIEEEKRRKLLVRRQRLSELLEKENKEYEVELKSRSPDQLATMRDRAEHLKGQREKERKMIADEKFYEHWKDNCPELRKVESRETNKHIVSEWGKQRERREQELETARQEKKMYELELEQDRLAALKLQDKEQERQKKELKEHSEVLKLQMREIKRREKEAALLEQKQAKLIQDQIELQKAEDSRKAMEEKRKKSELRRFLIHQCKAQLRRKSQQIQESLELDLAILEDLAEKEKEEQSLHTARRERARADTLWMKEMVTKQLEIEKQRELELDNMYREEAARLWQKREAEWEKEQQARERLMKEVFEERKQQINVKMDVLKEEQLLLVVTRV
ncbi:trichoplein keratin filament-binding protein-like isoform X2 [Halichondria panicea]|uniref:trichoplein keratin filament-binding protein-like isoform X2 n=1 Tax=Halichondria panicea TaxID=6063 RepID=UPI00312B34A6